MSPVNKKATGTPAREDHPGIKNATLYRLLVILALVGCLCIVYAWPHWPGLVIVAIVAIMISVVADMLSFIDGYEDGLSHAKKSK